MRIYSWLALLALFAAVGCGHASPLPPDPPGSLSGLEEGNYSALFFGAPLCTPSSRPAGGTAISTSLIARVESGQWVARTPADTLGNVVLVLRLQRGSRAATPSLQGSIAGSTSDLGLPGILEPNGVTVSFAGSTPSETANVTGVLYGTHILSGIISGNILFADSSTSSKTCSDVTWSLTRQP
jgi:hypothetical protein